MVPEAQDPITFILLVETPFIYFSINNKEIPPIPSPPVLTAVTKKSAYHPFVIHFLIPLTTKCLPSGVNLAVVFNYWTSEPPHGSVIAKQINLLPSKQLLITFYFKKSLPKCMTGDKLILKPPAKNPGTPADPHLHIS